MLIKFKRDAKTYSFFTIKVSDIIKERRYKILNDGPLYSLNKKNKTDITKLQVNDNTHTSLILKKDEDITFSSMSQEQLANGEIKIGLSTWGFENLIYNNYKASIVFYNNSSSKFPSVLFDCDLVIDSTLPNPVPPANNDSSSDVDDNEKNPPIITDPNKPSGPPPPVENPPSGEIDGEETVQRE